RIGHADPAITMQIYAHALEGDDATAPRSPPQPSSAGDTADGVNMVSRGPKTLRIASLAGYPILQDSTG
ncbi:MAG: hypothetical protein M3N57_05900, partial [Actinomycetota bacterium]|nr:hypothetical protein [Actinomycetota bacterium]